MSDVSTEVLVVPEIRDYELINKEILRALSEGTRRIVLSGVEGQRLLVSGLRGGWSATIEVHGNPGPEFAAGLDAPGLIVIVRGNAADGLGSGLIAGTIVVEGEVGEGLGYAQHGGAILVAGSARNRAGLRQSGGTLVVLGTLGRLAGEAQTGGVFLRDENRSGLHLGRGARGGERHDLVAFGGLKPEEREEILGRAPGLAPWLPAGWSSAPSGQR